MMALFNEAYIQDAYGYEKKMEGKREGRIEERVKSVLGMKEVNIPDDLIAKAMKIS